MYVGGYIPLLPIRLVNGSNPHNGRVEVYTNSTGGLFNARWGTVCDDEWDFYDARVVCRQLGYPDAVTALRSSHYGEGTLPIILSNVSCTGHEPNLTTCGHNGIGIHNCQHYKIATVECLGMLNVIRKIIPCSYLFMFAVPTFCPPVRLVGGRIENEGRVEIYYNNTWGTVCWTYWDTYDSNAVCRQLGYTEAIEHYFSPLSNQENLPVWMDKVYCDTYEICVGKCSFAGFGNNQCRHRQDVFIRCNGTRNFNEIG